MKMYVIEVGNAQEALAIMNGVLPELVIPSEPKEETVKIVVKPVEAMKDTAKDKLPMPEKKHRKKLNWKQYLGTTLQHAIKLEMASNKSMEQCVDNIYKRTVSLRVKEGISQAKTIELIYKSAIVEYSKHHKVV
jgi:hypothetical protein